MSEDKNNKSFDNDEDVLRQATGDEYKYGFVTDIDTDIIPKGLSEDVVRLISQKKNEPEWLLEFRLKAFRHWQTMAVPNWAHLKIPKIDFNAIEKEEVNTQTKVSTSNVHFDGSLYDILIVDDNMLNLKVAQRILSDYKFNITCLQSGAEAIEKIKGGARYDLIFLDHMMPLMDGIQTLKTLKNLEGVKVPPVIALTANAMVGMKEFYLKEGFDGYISKPINREELQVLLNNIFCKR